MRALTINLCLIASIFILTAAKTTELSTFSTNPPIAMALTIVINGSTFVVGEAIIKLWGVKSPAENNPQYLAAKLYLETILEAASFDCHYKTKNSLGQYVMQCFSEKQDVAAMMVTQGMAEDAQGLYKAEQKYAQEKYYGIWKGSPK